MADRQTTFSDLALALADDYESIYVINSKDDSYVEYTSEGADRELKVRSSGDDFFKDLISNCRELVWPEDQNRFLRALRKERMMETLEKGKSFDLRYRMNINNQPVYYFLKTIRNNGADIIIGVQNVDEQTRSEMKEDMEYVAFGEIARSLGSMFEAIYYINVENGDYTEYYANEEQSEMGFDSVSKDFFGKLQTDIEEHIFTDDRDMLRYELDRGNLLAKLKETGNFSLIYRQIMDGSIQYLCMFIIRQQNDSDHVVIAVRNIDSQIRNDEVLSVENRHFIEIAAALAQRYDMIYRVDLDTHEYYLYRAGKENGLEDGGLRDRDFFSDVQQELKKTVFPDDIPMMSEAMKKENLLNNLKDRGRVFWNFRILVDGEPRYYALSIVRPHEDSGHIIIAVVNVDQARRRELAFDDAMGNAMNMANRDALTGLQNKRFFFQREMELDNEIGKGNDISFAVVLCDINGLKKVNDSQGHKVGDQYIVEAAKMLGGVFRKSEICRIGGDEFAIILENEDYENRKKLMIELADLQTIHRENGQITVAFGMVEYEKGKDLRVQDVYERATKAMTVNKNSLRGRLRKSSDEKQVLNLSTDDRTMKFYELYVKLVSEMTDVSGNVDAHVAAIENLLIEISTMFRLSKGVTRVYMNPQEEMSGGGETLCCFDTGIEGKEIMSLRVVTSVMSIASMTIYMSPDEEPLTEEEYWRVELVVRTTLSYVSRNRLKNVVYQLAYYDDDGYLNHRYYFKQIVSRKNELGDMVAVMYNLLHFSQVNQTLGRKAGDLVMKNHFDGLLKIVGENGTVCRLGGDNFVALFGREKMGNVFAYLTNTPVVYDINDGKTVNVGTSIGVLRIPKDGKFHNPHSIMESITAAYNVAKNGGKDRVVFFDDSLISARDNSKKVQSLFPEALAKEEFKVYYQPKVHTETGRLIGAEALCRWFHDGEMVSPGAFIPMLEETDDICRLDFYMLEHVCRDIRRWIDEGKKVVRISVNLSRKHMLNQNLLEQLLKIIDRHNVPHSCIEIELTETTTDVAFSDLKRVVTGLQSAGIFASVDDFGIGYSSLNLIRVLPWNVLKVDRSILPSEDDDSDSVNSIMFHHVISMVNALGIECIVEGVETEKQLEILRSNHCFYAQGFYFDRPLPVEEFEKRMVIGYYPV